MSRTQGVEVRLSTSICIHREFINLTDLPCGLPGQKRCLDQHCLPPCPSAAAHPIPSHKIAIQSPENCHPHVASSVVWDSAAPPHARQPILNYKQFNHQKIGRPCVCRGYPPCLPASAHCNCQRERSTWVASQIACLPLAKVLQEKEVGGKDERRTDTAALSSEACNCMHGGEAGKHVQNKCAITPKSSLPV